MNYRVVSHILNEKDCIAQKRKLLYGYNRVRIHNRFETFEHFITKAMLTFLIFKKGKKGVITEAEMRNGRQIDVLQVARNGNLVGYEIENNKFDKIDVDGVDIIEINLKKMPQKAREGIKELEKFVKEYLI